MLFQKLFKKLKNINFFEQTVVYKFNQVKLLKTQEEKEVSAEIIVNLTEKIITINDESSEKEKGSVTYPIESIDCNYNNDLRDGYAFYRTWSQGSNEVTKDSVLKIETEEEGIKITFIDEKVETTIIHIDDLKVVKE